MTRTVLLIVVAAELAAALLLTRSIVAARHSPIRLDRSEPGEPVAPEAPPAFVPAAPDVPPPQPVPALHCPAPQAPTEPSAPPFTPRAWGQEQACGPPDSPTGGDVPTAWAPATADAQNEWLELTYAETIQPIAVFVFEACGPGSVSQIEFENEAGEWTTVWGDDPKPAGGSMRIINAAVDADFATRHVRMTLLSASVPSWNEIDAVGLLDRQGKVHWALSAIASSSYAGDSSEPLPPL